MSLAKSFDVGLRSPRSRHLAPSVGTEDSAPAQRPCYPSPSSNPSCRSFARKSAISLGNPCWFITRLNWLR